jgi:hypothetical protein
MYQHHKCRCDECKKGHRDRTNAFRAARRGKVYEAKDMSALDRVVCRVKRGDTHGSVLDVRGYTKEDLILINECFADVNVNAGESA